MSEPLAELPARARRGVARRSARRRSATGARSAATSARPRPRATPCRRYSSSAPRSSWRACAGVRAMPLHEFLLGVKQTALAPDELVTAVRLTPCGGAQTFMKVGPRNAMVIAICSLAVVVDTSAGEVRAAFGSAAVTAKCVTVPLSGRGGAPRSRGRGGVADRRRPRDRRLPPPRAPCPGRPRAREVPALVRIALTVNGERREADLWGGESLLTMLRDTLELPGSKNACEQGECGSCSVLLDGELVCSCLVLAAQVDGHEVVTVEGLARRRRAAPGAGGVRRGRRRCSAASARPGLVVAVADLLERRAEPVRGRDPRGAVRQHLPLHGLREDLRRGTSRGGAPVSVTAPRTRLSVGRVGERRAPRRRDAEGHGRVRVRERPLRPGMLWGDTLRSPHAHARIVSVDLSAALSVPGVHGVLTHADVPGKKHLRARVRRPAGARGRPRSVRRRARRSRRRRASRSRQSRRSPRSSSSTSRSSSSSTWSALSSRSRSTPTGRRWATATATTRDRTSSVTS